MADIKPSRELPTPDKSKPARTTQDRNSNIRIPEGVTPEQVMAGIFKIKPEDVKRIREQEQKVKGGQKRKG